MREEPGDRGLGATLAKNLDIAVGDRWAWGEYEVGLESYRRAIELWEQLRTEEPNNVEFGAAWATAIPWRDFEERHRRR